MRFWSLSADRACCSLALPRPLKTKALGFLALAAAASSFAAGSALRLALSSDFFLAAFLTFFSFFLGAALLIAIWAQTGAAPTTWKDNQQRQELLGCVKTLPSTLDDAQLRSRTAYLALLSDGVCPRSKPNSRRTCSPPRRSSP